MFILLGFSGKIAHIAATLLPVTRDHVRPLWTKQKQRAFGKLPKWLQKRPAVTLFNTNTGTTVYTEASNVDLGAVLLQRKDGAKMMIAYTCGTLSPLKGSSSASEREWWPSCLCAKM
ncbi:hypothetical protein HPB48_010373 [Haemaphysalis longicornis]|uniref:Reverse transcriptase/retrotransposon-derived protein RNase H-like domain-containing protein n=1 Tax=Haemaphysalis longicornis TaxID=44386 RepID=A0A9J6G888_HAELO|nr:hypothetical protein HPB48_010373 [Haemaphysalis longicornis]